MKARKGNIEFEGTVEEMVKLFSLEGSNNKSPEGVGSSLKLETYINEPAGDYIKRLFSSGHSVKYIKDHIFNKIMVSGYTGDIGRIKNIIKSRVNYYKNTKTVKTTRLKRRRSKNVNWKHVLGQDTKTYINEMINKNIERDIVTNRMIQLAKDRGINMTTRSLRRRVNLLYRGVVRQNEQVKNQITTDPLGV